MVDALQECWRVLRPAGQLLDMRPSGIDREIRVVAPNRVFLPGLVDVSRGNADDAAADSAMQRVEKQGLFIRECAEAFGYCYYWRSLADARGYVAERWADFASVSDETWARADAYVQNLGGMPVRVAIRSVIQLVSYQKA